MLDSPAIVHTGAQHTAVIRMTIPRAEIGNVMGPGFAELAAVAARQGIGPAGPFFSHHFRVLPDTFDFEIGVPVSAPVQPEGRVVAGSLPAARVARVVMQGDYAGLGEAWGSFLGWVEREGLKGAPDFWEVYAKGPESGPDPAGWRTELNKPLID